MMKHFNKTALTDMDFASRIKLINSISGYKSANLVGTIDSLKQNNLAIVSSVVHIGSDPALLGFFVKAFGERHTLSNILETHVFTINHINKDIAYQAHYTSAEFPKSVSEFEKCKLTPQFIDQFDAPFVAESRVKVGLTLADKMDIKLSGTTLIIGHVTHVLLENENYFDPTSGIDLNSAGTICISGLDSYHDVQKFASYEFAQVESFPDF